MLILASMIKDNLVNIIILSMVLIFYIGLFIFSIRFKNKSKSQKVSFDNEYLSTQSDIYSTIPKSLVSDDEIYPIQHSFLKSYWAKMTSILKMDFQMDKYALFQKDEDGLFSIVRNVGFSPNTVDSLKFTEYDSFYKNFFKYSKNLYISNNVFANKSLNEMIAEEDKASIGELILVPIIYKHEVIGLLCCARRKGLKMIDRQQLHHGIVVHSRL